MDWTGWLIAYVFGWLVAGTAIVDSPDRRYISASYIAAIAWPAMVSIELMRRLMRGNYE